MDLQTPDTRWKYLQRVAGEHQQDVTCLNLSRHTHLTPPTLKMGTPAAVARRVTELQLNVLQRVVITGQDEDHSLGELTAWLDAISETFPALKHLKLEQPQTQQQQTIVSKISHSSVDDIIELRCDSSVSTENVSTDKYATEPDETPTPTSHKNLSDDAMVRRLYILHRLPLLESLDGIPVCATERRLAHPGDPGHEEITSSCLLDVEEDEENQSRASPKPKRGRPALAETAVEVDVNGRPLTGSPRNRAALRSNNSSPELRAAGTPTDSALHCPALYDLSRLEYESVESTQVCEWGAACGALSLPYFRNRARFPDREKTKSRFHLKVGRSPPGIRNQPETAHTQTHKGSCGGAAVSLQLPHASRNASPCRATDPVIHVEDMNDHGEIIFEARPQRQRIGLSSPSSTRGKALANTLLSLDMTLSSSSHSLTLQHHPPPSQSLTCPFPMQFRARFKEATSLTVSTDLAVLDSNEATLRFAPRDTDDLCRETIEYPILFTRTQSSPTKLPSDCGRTSDLPPPFPGSKRAMNTTTTGTPRFNMVCSTGVTKPSRTKRRGQRWRVKLQARSASIMDDDDEEDDNNGEESEYAESDISEDNVLVSKEDHGNE